MPGTIGIIPAFSRTFCGSCNRIRITAKGELKNCLYDRGVLDIKELLRNNAYDTELKQIPPGKNYFALTKRDGHPNPKFEANKRFWSFLLKLHRGNFYTQGMNFPNIFEHPTVWE